MYSMAIKHSPAPFTESNQVTLEPRALPSPAGQGAGKGCLEGALPSWWAPSSARDWEHTDPFPFKGRQSLSLGLKH